MAQNLNHQSTWLAIYPNIHPSIHLSVNPSIHSCFYLASSSLHYLPSVHSSIFHLKMNILILIVSCLMANVAYYLSMSQSLAVSYDFYKMIDLIFSSRCLIHPFTCSCEINFWSDDSFSLFQAGQTHANQGSSLLDPSSIPLHLHQSLIQTSDLCSLF